VNIPTSELENFCRKWEIIEFSLFGSILREDFGPESDVDVLVTFADDAEWSLYNLVDMQEELKTIFGRDVDLVLKSGLRNPSRRREILRTQRLIYAA
jgi:predicted nucleotidyltransferase